MTDPATISGWEAEARANRVEMEEWKSKALASLSVGEDWLKLYEAKLAEIKRLQEALQLIASSPKACREWLIARRISSSGNCNTLRMMVARATLRGAKP